MISNDHFKIFEPTLSVNSLIADIKWKPPQTLEEKNRELNRLLSTCPQSKGGGIHQWLFIVARFLHRLPYMFIPEAILQCLREATQNCERKVTEQELLDAVNNSNPDNIRLKSSESGSGKRRLPSRCGLAKAKAITAGGINLQGLINCDGEIFLPQYTLGLLFSDRPLQCFAYLIDRPEGVIATTWDDASLRPFPPLMVPNPLVGKWGYTTDGRPSERALSNVGKRRYLVLDFDEGTKDEHVAILGYLRQQWQKHQVPLVMVMDSGRRSLHGWFDVRHLDEPEIWTLCRQAYRLGADQATFGKQQLVRVPGAIRPKGNKRQQVYYFSESEILPTTRIKRRDENNQ